MKILKIIGWVGLIALIIVQFFHPEKNTTENTEYVAAFESETKPMPEVKTILETTCYDCHSDNTVYPWYSNIAPVSFWMDEHIEHGKEHLDFSDWQNYSVKKKDHKLEELIEEVEKGEMPLNEYTWTHGDARLTDEQRKLLMDWAREARSQYDIAQ